MKTYLGVGILVLILALLASVFLFQSPRVQPEPTEPESPEVVVTPEPQSPTSTATNGQPPRVTPPAPPAPPVSPPQQTATSTVVSKAPADAFERRVYEAINRERANRGLRPLLYFPQLEQAADLKMADMLSSGYFDHTSPSGVKFDAFLDRAGYPRKYAGENLSRNIGSPEDVVEAFMNSQAHRDNVLRSVFTEIGFSYDPGPHSLLAPKRDDPNTKERVTATHILVVTFGSR